MARWAVFAGVAAAAFAVALTLTSGHVRYRWGDALFLADNIAGFSAARAYWLVRRPRLTAISWHRGLWDRPVHPIV